MRKADNNIDLGQLQAELIKAGIFIPNGMTWDGVDILLVDIEGNQQDLPPEAQAIVDAHTPVDLEAVALAESLNARWKVMEQEAIATAIKVQVMAVAQTAVGMQISLLTPVQQQAILMCLLFNAGGISSDMRVQPLDRWVL